MINTPAVAFYFSPTTTTHYTTYCCFYFYNFAMASTAQFYILRIVESLMESPEHLTLPKDFTIVSTDRYHRSALPCGDSYHLLWNFNIELKVHWQKLVKAACPVCKDQSTVLWITDSLFAKSIILGWELLNFETGFPESPCIYLITNNDWLFVYKLFIMHFCLSAEQILRNKHLVNFVDLN